MKYITDEKLEVGMERIESEEAKARFKKLFKPTMKLPESLCGNIQVSFTPEGVAVLGNETGNNIPSYKQISSALACYRAISVFEYGTAPKQQDFYKCNWSVALKHKSGKYLMLGEWKGGFQIFTEGHDVTDLPKNFVKDCEAFLTWFVSNQVTIGYDGVVAGSVA